MAYDVEFTDGFDKYGPVGRTVTMADLGGEWTQAAAVGQVTLTLAVGASLAGLGASLKYTHRGISNISGGSTQLAKTLPGDYERVVGEATFAFQFNAPDDEWGMGFAVFADGGANQVALCINLVGRIEARRGGVYGDLIATSSRSVSLLSEHSIGWDLTFDDAAGEIHVTIDGTPAIDVTGVDTAPSGLNRCNVFGIKWSCSSVSGANQARSLWIDNLYLWLFEAAGGVETPAVNTIVETQFPIGDHSVDFAFGAGVLGQAEAATTTTSAPGANRLSLRRFTPDVDCDLDSIGLLPQATHGTAKFKGVAYADSAGAPGALLSSGTEVAGCVLDTLLTLPLITPQALTAGTPVWVGYITDASVVVAVYDDAQLGYGAANTYASGAPTPAPAMTGNLASWLIWGNVSGVAVNYAEVDENPALGDLSYVASDTVNDEDLFSFPALSTTPTTIYTVAVKGNIWLPAGGARTVDMRHKAGATTGSGINTGLTPAASPGWIASYFREDPDTAAGFNASGLNAGFSGYKIAS